MESETVLSSPLVRHSHLTGQFQYSGMVQARRWTKDDSRERDLRDGHSARLLWRCSGSIYEAQVIIRYNVTHGRNHGEKDDHPKAPFGSRSASFRNIPIAMQDGLIEVWLDAGQIGQRGFLQGALAISAKRVCIFIKVTAKALPAKGQHFSNWRRRKIGKGLLYQDVIDEILVLEVWLAVIIFRLGRGIIYEEEGSRLWSN